METNEAEKIYNKVKENSIGKEKSLLPEFGS